MKLLGSKCIRLYYFEVNHPGWSCLYQQLPPTEEQVSIADHLFAENDKALKTIEAITQGIALLLERRSSLISAAVTGQIDARSLVSEEEVAA